MAAAAGRVSGEVLEERREGTGEMEARICGMWGAWVCGEFYLEGVGVGNVRVGLPGSKFEIRFEEERYFGAVRESGFYHGQRQYFHIE
jgi:hypothetical protein